MSAAGLGTCVRCMTPRRAVTVERLSFGTSTYRLPLCDQHADMFQANMFGWSRCGELEEEFVSFAPKIEPPPERQLGRLVASHVAIPAGEPVAKSPEPVRDVPQPRFDPTPLINASRWTFTEHARERMTQREVGEQDALWCAEHPDVIRDGDEGRKVHIRGPIKVVVDPATHRIITVADRRYEDQERELSHAS